MGSVNSGDRKTTSYDAAYNAITNSLKEKYRGRAPTQTGSKVFNGRENMNIISKKQNARVPTRKHFVSQEFHSKLEMHVMKKLQVIEHHFWRGQAERFNPSQLNQL